MRRATKINDNVYDNISNFGCSPTINFWTEFCFPVTVSVLKTLILHVRCVIRSFT